MRIGLYDVDSKIPNLAIMKLSAYWKNRGAKVEPYMPLFKSYYDKIFASTIFNFSNKKLVNPDLMEVGGSGWDLHKNLPSAVEVMNPDYTFYNYPHSIGFTMRGCRFKCKFCVVPEKEGAPKSNNTIREIWTNRGSNFIVLLDNDFFGNPEWRERLDEISKYDLDVNFNQGLNIRIITDEQAKALATVKFWNLHHTSRQVYFAWDRFRDEKLIDEGIKRVINAGIKPWQMAFYVLIGFNTTPEEDLYRVIKIRDYGCDPFVMPYDKSNAYQRAFARWVNHKATFRTVEWKEYNQFSIKQER